MACRIPNCQFPTPSRYLFCLKHYKQIPSKLFFAYQQALKEGNKSQLEIALQAIVEEMSEIEKDFAANLQALKNEPVQEFKEGLFD